METAPNQDQPHPAAFRSRRVLPYPPQRVFDAFARPEFLSRFWGPKGFTSTFQVFEFRPGGRWNFIMHGPDGTDYPNQSVFTRLEAPSTWAVEHLLPPHFTLTVTLSPQDGGTALTWLQEFKDPAVAAKIKPIVEPANEQNLDRLEAVLAGDVL